MSMPVHASAEHLLKFASLSSHDSFCQRVPVSLYNYMCQLVQKSVAMPSAQHRQLAFLQSLTEFFHIVRCPFVASCLRRRHTILQSRRQIVFLPGFFDSRSIECTLNLSCVIGSRQLSLRLHLIAVISRMACAVSLDFCRSLHPLHQSCRFRGPK